MIAMVTIVLEWSSDCVRFSLMRGKAGSRGGGEGRAGQSGRGKEVRRAVYSAVNHGTRRWHLQAISVETLPVTGQAVSLARRGSVDSSGEGGEAKHRAARSNVVKRPFLRKGGGRGEPEDEVRGEEGRGSTRVGSIR